METCGWRGAATVGYFMDKGASLYSPFGVTVKIHGEILPFEGQLCLKLAMLASVGIQNVYSPHRSTGTLGFCKKYYFYTSES